MKENEPIVREKPIRRPGSKRQIGLAIFIIVILLMILGVSYYIFMPKTESFFLKSYTYSQVKQKAIKDTLLCTGNIQMRHPELLLAPVEGVVDYLGAASGDKVKRGQLLVRIKSRTLEEQLFTANHDLSKTKRQLEQLTLEQQMTDDRHRFQMAQLQKDLATAEEEFQKMQSLYEAGACSFQELQAKKKAAESAQAATTLLQKEITAAAGQSEYNISNLKQEITAHEWRLSRFKQELAACQITSPMNGEIMECFVEAGSYVDESSRVLTVFDPGQTVLVVMVPDNKINKIKAGQLVEIEFNKEKYPGRVTKIAALVQGGVNSSGSVPVEVAFTKQPKLVVIGGTAIAEIVLGVKKAALCLPRGPFLTTGGQVCLFRLDQKRQSAHKVEATFGIINGNDVEIVKGAKADDKVIVSGYQDYINWQVIGVNPKGGVLK